MLIFLLLQYSLTLLDVLKVSPNVGQAPLTVRVEVRTQQEWRGRVCIARSWEGTEPETSCWDQDPEDAAVVTYRYTLDAGTWTVWVTHAGRIVSMREQVIVGERLP